MAHYYSHLRKLSYKLVDEIIYYQKKLNKA